MTNELKKALGDILARAESIDVRIDALVEMLLENKVIETRRYGHRVATLSGPKQQFWSQLRHDLEEAIQKEEDSLLPMDAEMNRSPN